ncbi:hypothetical protein [Streptomyces sp. NPDC056796]|uniref:hypothetical protein n=1 Tax=Streptomyces sp. NPDC056796 TaxID=3345947 RepID=UPI0036B1EAD2
MILRHDDLVRVQDESGRVVLALYNHYEGELPFLTFFGSSWTGQLHDFPLVEVVEVVPRA